MIPTTLVRLTDKRLNTPHRLWTTLEGENPSGSIKDRIVEPELLIKENLKQVSEISAGSTAVSLSYYAQKMNIQCHFFVPDNISEETKKRLLKGGALLTLCNPNKAYELYEKFCELNATSIWPFHQMKRKELKLHYYNWASRHLAPLLKSVDHVIGAVGTGHSLLGVTTGLAPKLGCIAVEPADGQSISGVRNLRLQHFGTSDPCDTELIDKRIEVALYNDFSDSRLETDHGAVYIGDSFKLALVGTLEYLNKQPEPKNIFIVGSGCRRL